MVSALDLQISSSEITRVCSRLRLRDSAEEEIDYFATLAWATICEPGDAFAGQLISTFGAARALALELAKTSGQEYVRLFAEAGSDWLEMQAFGRFERTLADARERWLPRMSTAKLYGAVDAMAGLDGWFITKQSDLWPQRLGDLKNHAPRGLWGIGNPNAELDRAISVVGSRVSSTYGESVTSQLIGPMVSRGLPLFPVEPMESTLRRIEQLWLWMA